MRIQILSDLHLERGSHYIPEKTTADVVVLAGDIHTGIKGISWARKSFPDNAIVYVAGNHEFYQQSWERLTDGLRKEANTYEVNFLENDEIQLGGVRFLGSTLWTDFEFFGASSQAIAMNQIEAESWEYAKIIGPDGLGIRAQDTLTRHRTSRGWLQNRLSEKRTEPTVVVTHHYPCRRSTPPKYAEVVKTAAFGSHLDHLLGTPAAWIHGHTHTTCDYVQAGTRIICNPLGGRGPGESPENEKFDPSMTIDLSVD